MKGPRKPRKEPRQARSRFLVEAIIEAAARVFDAHGYDGANTNLVARTAGVSVGSVYQYFPDKDALVTALHERHVRQMLELLEQVDAAADGSSLREATEVLVQKSLDVHRTEPRLQRLLHADLPTLEQKRALSAASRAVFERTRHLLLRHRPEIVQPDLDLATYVVLRMFEELVHAAALDPPPGVEDGPLRRAIADAIVGYLTTAAAPGRPGSATDPR
ncbi:TetR family transcriptional regulator [Sorangium cellulosum]|uniref:TetR family transcriptional regulator n=1 Tax=Sorangium cellulosum TaxID=56 RepID=A0A2L0EPE6_SORCE|nr:TetR/AcrR family transcriptional regulator [Sorangium cellulosum]AUX41145.1 TetR family transcriptional regulator [Sorangium cellulosum]